MHFIPISSYHDFADGKCFILLVLPPPPLALLLPHHQLVQLLTRLVPLLCLALLGKRLLDPEFKGELRDRFANLMHLNMEF